MSKDSTFLFNTIAPIYGLFFRMQKKLYRRVIDQVVNDIDLKSYKNILDVGCGTGALCSVLVENGLSVTGVEPAEKMLRIAKHQVKNCHFMQASVLDSLPFEDKSFDVSIASYVAHGLHKDDRMKMYQEMSRVTRHKVIIYDYNQNRSFLTSLIEWLEHGDYFNFIKVAKSELQDCVSDMKKCFKEVQVINVDSKAAWYICTPIESEAK